MGAVLSVRNRVNATGAVSASNHNYTYPSVGGSNYFSSHYYLGTKKFETADPESYLYGDLADINHMTDKPHPFPYKQPPKKKPIDCLNAHVFLHKESLKLIKVPGGEEGEGEGQYSVQFQFDSVCKCNVFVICMMSRLVTMASLKNGSVPDEGWISQKYSFDEGMEQEYSESTLKIPLTEFNAEKLIDCPEVHSLAILVETASHEFDYQSLLTICHLNKNGDNNYTMKVVKQKFLIDSLEYIFHEIFGLENKTTPTTSNKREEDCDNDSCSSSEDEDDLGAECVICFTDVKDTIILPCRHFCLCASCAADLRYQASNCPICRAPFTALMQLQAVQKLSKEEQPDDDQVSDNPELYSVPGCKVMSLLQGINGYPKLKKNKPDDSVPPILMTPSADEGEGPAEHHTSYVTIDQLSNEVIISFDDETTPTRTTPITPLLEQQQVLPDLIPPGSIPGTPEDNEESLVKPDSIAMVITAQCEDSNSSSGTPSVDSTPSTARTDVNSMRSSTSFDSANSNDVLIKDTPTSHA